MINCDEANGKNDEDSELTNNCTTLETEISSGLIDFSPTSPVSCALEFIIESIT